jgi:hypothetical protein
LGILPRDLGGCQPHYENGNTRHILRRREVIAMSGQSYVAGLHWTALREAAYGGGTDPFGVPHSSSPGALCRGGVVSDIEVDPSRRAVDRLTPLFRRCSGNRHGIFRYAQRMDSRVRTLNMAWLLTIVINPFATG